jgi:hypothetical protein
MILSSPLESIQDCVVVLQGVPSVPLDALESFKDALLEKLNECAPVKRMMLAFACFSVYFSVYKHLLLASFFIIHVICSRAGESLFISVDMAKKRSQPWAVIECVTPKGPAQLAKKLPPLLLVLKSELEHTEPVIGDDVDAEGEGDKESVVIEASATAISTAPNEGSTTEAGAKGEEEEVKRMPEAEKEKTESSEQKDAGKEKETEKPIARSGSSKKSGSTESIRVSALKELGEDDANVLEYCRSILFDQASPSEEPELSAQARATLQDIFKDLAKDSPRMPDWSCYSSHLFVYLFILVSSVVHFSFFIFFGFAVLTV